MTFVGATEVVWLMSLGATESRLITDGHFEKTVVCQEFQLTYEIMRFHRLFVINGDADHT